MSQGAGTWTREDTWGLMESNEGCISRYLCLVGDIPQLYIHIEIWERTDSTLARDELRERGIERVVCREGFSSSKPQSALIRIYSQNRRRVARSPIIHRLDSYFSAALEYRTRARGYRKAERSPPIKNNLAFRNVNVSITVHYPQVGISQIC